jgi:glycerol-3-phosphate dehydrogenase (NAD(P)+)
MIPASSPGSAATTLPPPSLESIAVLGAGSWGTALAIALARNGHAVWLWGHEPGHCAALARMRENADFLPGIRFPDKLQIEPALDRLARLRPYWLVAVPSHAFRATLRLLKPLLAAEATLAWATKGLEPGSGALLSQVLEAELPGVRATGVVSGPSFAREVALNLPTALVAAADEPVTAERIAQWLHGGHLRVYTSTDVAGVQLGGATKNVMAIAAGISDGLGFGANARAALVTRGLAELTRFGVALGGRAETFMGLTGVGDLVLTCTDDHSRNRRLGLGLGRGRRRDDVLREIGQEVEGVATAREIYRLARARGIDMPITEQVYRVLHEDLSPQEAVEALLRREPKTE